MSDQQQCDTNSSCSSCSSAQQCDQSAQQEHMNARLNGQLSRIKHKILVMSGKGGVGKSTVATNLAVALSELGKKVGILDGDVHGPNIPKMLGLEGQVPSGGPNGLAPLEFSPNLKIMSVSFLLPDSDTPVIWRGPMKHSLMQQFVGEVIWGDLDYLIVDLPPGTGDEAMSIAQILGNPLSAVIVTTPQEVALLDSRKSVMFARTLGLNIVGIIENMSGLKCPHCSEIINLFKTGGGKKAAEEMGLNFLGALPIIPEVVKSADAGIPLLELDEASGIGVIFKELARNLDDTLNTRP